MAGGPNDHPIYHTPFAPDSLSQIGDQQIWSTFRFGAGKPVANGTYRLFVVPQGQAGQGFVNGITNVETSMIVGGKLFQSINVRSVCWTIWGSDPDDVTMIYHNTCWKWEFLQTHIDGSALNSTPLSHIECLAGLPKDERERILDLYCDADRSTRFGVAKFEKIPTCIPTNHSFALLIKFGSDLPQIKSDTFVRFNLIGEYTNALPIY